MPTQKQILASIDTRLGEILSYIKSPPAPPTPMPVPPVATDNPFVNAVMYVDPDSQAANAVRNTVYTDVALLNRIASQPQFFWLGAWSGNVRDYVRGVLEKAKGQLVGFVVYNIPLRDNGGHSAGGASNLDEYRKWVEFIAQGVKDVPSSKVVFCFEPDGLPLLDGISDQEQQNRIQAMNSGIDILAKVGPVYVDIGHGNWHSADEMKRRLSLLNTKAYRGVSVNVSNYQTTDDCLTFGSAFNLPFIIDTSRNGNGPSGAEWLNPRGRALGEKPMAIRAGHLEAYLWVKRPGESDGAGNGGPNAGQWWQEIALELARNAIN